ncbi:MAG: O-antigen ligase family protein [Leucobacter sp.]
MSVRSPMSPDDAFRTGVRRHEFPYSGHLEDRGRTTRKYFYYLYIAFTLGGATALLIPQDSSGRGSNLVFSIAWICMHGLSVLLFFGVRRHNPWSLVFVLAFGGYVISTSLWSADPKSSLAYGGMVAGNLLVAHMMSHDLELDEFLEISLRVILVLALAGLVLGLAGFSQAVYYDSGGRPTIIGTNPIRGLFNHKVPAALYATIGAVLALYLRKGTKRLFYVGALGLFVVLTGSSTGLVIFPAAVLAYFFFAWLSKRESAGAILGVIVFFVIAPLIGYLLSNFATILDYLGRDVTLTGRTLLWDWGIQAWGERPIFGWGFNGYLNGPGSAELSAAISRFENYEAPHFHQSYIQTAVDLGVVGLLVLVGVQFSIVRRAWVKLRSGMLPAGIPVITLMLVLVISAMTMFLFVQYNIYTTLFTFFVFFALRGLSRSKGDQPGSLAGPPSTGHSCCPCEVG